MSTVSRLLIAAAVAALATACGSVQQADSSVQLPGETPKRTGLEVPPDAWAHPALQTASAPRQR
ncbi:hypothetical protein BH10PSE6_BH10PSE6_35240 [soil metagenome]